MDLVKSDPKVYDLAAHVVKAALGSATQLSTDFASEVRVTVSAIGTVDVD